MIKKLFALLLIVSLLGCEKKQEKVGGCGTGLCTLSFAILQVNYTDKDGNPVAVQNFTAVNQRTQQSVLPTNQHDLVVKGQYAITDDGAKDKFSNDGDEVVVSATYAPTGQTKTATFKISGGCNCHIEKLSGPQTIKFD
ncbi:hypothetical protein [Mucilaginibacter antarcticus]|uniref:Lipoprotein n=1 Tax=Mucilaginibacter antarcticus TaxID=1855725 RepID=A0ABW5XMG7_9SPHI